MVRGSCGLPAHVLLWHPGVAQHRSVSTTHHSSHPPAMDANSTAGMWRQFPMSSLLNNRVGEGLRGVTQAGGFTCLVWRHCGWALGVLLSLCWPCVARSNAYSTAELQWACAQYTYINKSYLTKSELMVKSL